MKLIEESLLFSLASIDSFALLLKVHKKANFHPTCYSKPQCISMQINYDLN